MKLDKKIKSLLLAAIVAGVGTNAFAEITVDQSNGVLTISSDMEGTVIAKVIGPDDKVVVDESFSGSFFSWSPSTGLDGAYRYDVRVLPQSQNDSEGTSTATNKSDYAGGSVEVKNGQIDDREETL